MNFIAFVNVHCQIQTEHSQKWLDRAVNIEIIRLNTSTRFYCELVELLSDHVKRLTVLSTFDGLLSSGPPPRLKHTDFGKTIQGGTANV
ncbi:MAG: hypothetical protein ACKO5Q_27930 [Microcystaceae cyanobacterium]